MLGRPLGSACAFSGHGASPGADSGAALTTRAISCYAARVDSDLTQAVRTAKSGLRRDVRQLVDALPHGELLVPLARDIAGAPEGERVEIADELTLAPHLLIGPGGEAWAALFTRAELVGPIEERFGWQTDEAPLKVCALPARLALDMALEVVDDENVVGLVVNPLHESELVLNRVELGSIARGQPLPLVGYVDGIPRDEAESTLVAEPGDPPPAAMLAALERCLADLDEVVGHSLRRTFNPDRDLEPHLTLTLLLAPQAVDRAALARRVVEAIEQELPPPGYIDVLFEEKKD